MDTKIRQTAITGGYILDFFKTKLFIVEPSYSENLVLNPSLEFNNDGYAAINSSIERTTNYQYKGSYSLKITPNSGVDGGVYYETINLSIGSNYNFSAYLLGINGQSYSIYVTDTSGNILSAITSFISNGKWQRRNITYIESTGGIRRLCIVRQSSTDVNPFYVDGLMLIEKPDVEIYFDGDDEGYLRGSDSFYWYGEPHASKSIRIADTRAGGIEKSFSDYGFDIESIKGLGNNPVNNITEELPAGGGYFQTTIPKERQFIITGSLNAGSIEELFSKKSKLMRVLKYDIVNTPQPLLIRYKPNGDDGECFNIPCVYQEGLEGNITNDYQEKIVLIFKQLDPKIYSDLSHATSIETYNILDRPEIKIDELSLISRGFSTSIFGTGVKRQGDDGSVVATFVSSDGTLYIGGAFDTINGIPANGIAKWDGNSWSALGQGVTTGGSTGGSVYTICEDYLGNIWIGGTFHIVGTNPTDKTTWNLARWNPTTNIWQGMYCGGYPYSYTSYTSYYSPRIAAAVFKVYLNDYDNCIYAVGGYAFGYYSATKDYSSVAKYVEGSGWTYLGYSDDTGKNGADHNVMDIINVGANIYIVGRFANVYNSSAVAAAGIAKWNGTTWSAVGSGLNASANCIIKSGTDLYIGGTFTTAGGVTVNGVCKLVGTTYSALSSGITLAYNDEVKTLLIYDNKLYAGGRFSLTGASLAVPNLAVWNGSNWIAPYFSSISGGSYIYYNTTINSLIELPDKSLCVAGSYTELDGMEIGGIAAAPYEIGYYDSSILAYDGSALSKYLGITGFINCIFNSSSGDMYVGGTILAANGIAVNNIFKYSSGTVSALGTGLNGAVRAIAEDGSGNIYVVGDFTTAGGSSANRIAMWDGSTWSTLGTGFNSDVYCIAEDGSGNIYVGGNFTTADGNAALRVAVWSGAAWVALGSGLNDIVNDLEFFDGELYAGGEFYQSGSYAVNYIAKYDNGDWISLTPGSGLNGAVKCLRSSSNYLYAVGTFNIADDIIVNYITKYNGRSYSAILEGLNNPSYSLLVIDDGEIYMDLSLDVLSYNGVSAGYDIISLPDYVVGNKLLFIMDGISTYRMYYNKTINEYILLNTLLDDDVYAMLYIDKMVKFINSNGLDLLDTIRLTPTFATFRLIPGNNEILILRRNWLKEYNDTNNQLSGYGSLVGLNYTNTNDGTLYFSLVNISGSNYRVDIFKDYARTARVAYTPTFTSPGIQALITDNSSGISGSIYIDAIIAADANIYVNYNLRDITLQWNTYITSLEEAYG